MRNSCMTERQPKRRQHNMQFTFWNNAVSRFRKSAKWVSSRSLSLRSMRNCLGTGGSKDQFSWNNSFATQQTKGISGSQRRVNIYPQLNAASLRMCEVAGRYATGCLDITDTCDRVLKQLARELLLAQSSDWA